jgi:hypothetical protein
MPGRPRVVDGHEGCPSGWFHQGGWYRQAGCAALVPVRGNQISAVSRAVDGNLAFGAAADGANLLRLGGTESRSFALLTDGAGPRHEWLLERAKTVPQDTLQEGQNTKQPPHSALPENVLGEPFTRSRVPSRIMQTDTTPCKAPPASHSGGWVPCLLAFVLTSGWFRPGASLSRTFSPKCSLHTCPDLPITPELN